MRRLSRWAALIVSMLLISPLPQAENTSKTQRIAFNCGSTKVHVRLFDQSGSKINEYDTNLITGLQVITHEDSHSVEASKRYVATSSSSGCIQGRGILDSDTEAPINEFVMPCSTEAPVDLRITSDPPAKFKIRREIPSNTGLICHWEVTLNQGSIIHYYTPDEKLIIEAKALSDPLITGYLELDWDHVPHTKTTFPNQRRAGHDSGDVTRQLKTFTIESKPAEPIPTLW